MLRAPARQETPRPPTSLSERAYLVVRDRILKGQLALGAALSRRKLAAELGMSLLPVAEALQRLENEGLVESRPRIGTRVCLPTAQDIREHFEVREALESQAARLFAERATVREKLELQSMAEHMDALFNRCFASSDHDSEFLYAVHSYHAQLHFRIAECTGCRALRQAIERNHVVTYTWLFDVAARRPPLPPSFHRDLIDALCRGGAEAADCAMREHVRYGIENVVRGIEAALQSQPPGPLRRLSKRPPQAAEPAARR
jgi:DNA-binding GntR family transcriptional regulator